MQLRKKNLITVLTGLIYFSCANQKDFFLFVPLEAFKYEEGKIEPGARVKLLAYSGGQENKDDKIYYSQFLVVPENTTDTIVVLSPLISYNQSETDSSKIHSPAFSFNPPPDLLNARYDELDSTTLKTLAYTNQLQSKKEAASKDFDGIFRNAQFQHLVITNRKMPEFDGKHYKTTVGVLHFRKQPM